jgi:hypothetical protein
MQDEAGKMLDNGQPAAEGTGLAPAIPASKVESDESWRIVPVPVSEQEKPDWRNPPKYSYGRRLLDEIDPERNILETHQQQKILALESDDAVRALLYADLGSTLHPDIRVCEKIFGRLISLKIEIPNMIGTWRIHTLAQSMMAIDEGRKLAGDKSLSGAERVEAHRSMVEAIHVQGRLVDKMVTIFNKMGMIEKAKRDRSKKKPVVNVTRAAPE